MELRVQRKALREKIKSVIRGRLQKGGKERPNSRAEGVRKGASR